MLQRRNESNGQSKAGHAAELGRTAMGLGLAGKSAIALQPSVGRSARQTLERTQAVRLVGRSQRPMDRTRRARLRKNQTAGLHAAGWSAARSRTRGMAPVHHARRRFGVAL